ncbi:MAG: PilN domain-containing protein [Anaerolineales bacterium]|jgi:Tfp pilus assembly protein PilN
MEDPTTQPKQINNLLIRGTPDLFDINILPARYQRKQLTFLMILPWLLLLILLGTLYPTYTIAVKTQDIFRQARLDFAQTQVKLDFFQSNTEELELLQTQIEEKTAERDQILESYSGLDLAPEDWSPTLFKIQAAVPKGIVLSFLSRQGDAYRLEGIASQYLLVSDLADDLAGIDALTDIEIDQIEQIAQENAPVLPDLPPTEAPENPETAPAEPTFYAFTILFDSTGEVQP